MTPKPSTDSRLLYKLTNWALLAGGIANLGIGTWNAATSHIAVASLTLPAGLLLTFASTIDRFEFIKGLGIEAKTRKLDQKIEEAEVALRELKALTVLTGRSLMKLDNTAKVGIPAPNYRKVYQISQDLRSIMGGLNMSRSLMVQALEPWAMATCTNLANLVLHPLRNKLFRLLDEIQQGFDTPQASDLDPADEASRQQILSYLDRLATATHYALTDYPEKFIELINTAPAIHQKHVQPFLERARQLAPVMKGLRDDFILEDPEKWLHELETHSINNFIAPAPASTLP